MRKLRKVSKFYKPKHISSNVERFEELEKKVNRLIDYAETVKNINENYESLKDGNLGVQDTEHSFSNKTFVIAESLSNSDKFENIQQQIENGKYFIRLQYL